MRRLLGGLLLAGLLGCTGLWWDAVEIPIPEGAVVRGRSGGGLFVHSTEKLEFEFEEKLPMGEGNRRVIAALRGAGLDWRPLPRGEGPKDSLGRFGSGGTWFAVQEGSERWYVRLEKKLPEPVPPPDTIAFTGGELLSAAEALRERVECSPEHDVLLPDGHTERPSLGDRWEGRWTLQDGHLVVRGRVKPRGQVFDPDAFAEQESLSCRHARLWTRTDGKRVWACAHALVACDRFSASGAYVSVRDAGGGPEAVSKAAHIATRLFAPNFPHHDPHVLQVEPASPRSGLRVIWGPGQGHREEELALQLLSLLERDLGVTGEIAHDPEADAPFIVEIGS